MMHPVADKQESGTGWNLMRAALLLGALAMPLILLQGKSVTLDEVAHVPAGYSYLRTHEIVLNPMHPPLVKELCALPLLWLDLNMPINADGLRELGRDIFFQWKFGATFLRTQGAERVLRHTRPVAVLFSVGLAAVITVWAAELWGPAGGAIALCLYVFDPTITAHAQLVTTDIPFAFFATLFLYWLRSAVRLPSWLRTFRAGLGLGLALATKFSAVVLIPIAALLVALACVSAPPRDRPYASRSLPIRLMSADAFADRLIGAAAAFGVMLIVAFGVVWATYFFPSDPFFYVRGMSLVKADFDPRHRFFFMGELARTPWRSYFLVAWLVKTPLPELALIVVGAILLILGTRKDWLDEAFVLVPLIALFFGYSRLAAPIGIRYVLPCYPFLYLLAARTAVLLRRSTLARASVFAALAWSIVEFVSIWPDHLPYFNEIAGGWRGGFRWLDDSSIDWGQGLLELRNYVAANGIDQYTLCTVGNFDPNPYYGMNARLLWLDEMVTPPSGILIMSSHCLAVGTAWLNGLFGDGPQNWLAHLTPKDIVAHTYYVYDVPPGP
jgi:hypothetical protein